MGVAAAAGPPVAAPPSFDDAKGNSSIDVPAPPGVTPPHAARRLARIVLRFLVRVRQRPFFFFKYVFITKGKMGTSDKACAAQHIPQRRAAAAREAWPPSPFRILHDIRPKP